MWAPDALHEVRDADFTVLDRLVGSLSSLVGAVGRDVACARPTEYGICVQQGYVNPEPLQAYVPRETAPPPPILPRNRGNLGGRPLRVCRVWALGGRVGRPGGVRRRRDGTGVCGALWEDEVWSGDDDGMPWKKGCEISSRSIILVYQDHRAHYGRSLVKGGVLGSVSPGPVHAPDICTDCAGASQTCRSVRHAILCRHCRKRGQMSDDDTR